MRTRPFEVGDRVVRPREIQSKRHYEDFWRGTIVRIYSDTPNGIRKCNVLYAVKWDGEDTIRDGYLSVGLEREPLMVPTVTMGR